MHAGIIHKRMYTRLYAYINIKVHTHTYACIRRRGLCGVSMKRCAKSGARKRRCCWTCSLPCMRYACTRLVQQHIVHVYAVHECVAQEYMIL